MTKTHFSIEANAAKTRAVNATAPRDLEVERLRAEVRHLRLQVEQLETRLGEWDDEDSDRWAIWPYNWLLLSWQFAQERFHSIQLNNSRRVLRRHNARLKRQWREFSACEGVPLRVV